MKRVKIVMQSESEDPTHTRAKLSEDTMKYADGFEMGKVIYICPTCGSQTTDAVRVYHGLCHLLDKS